MPTVLGLSNSNGQSQVSTDVKSNGDHKDNKEKGRNSSGKPKGRLDTISKRNHAAAIDSETLLWRAMTDDPEEALEYLADDCSMLNPVSFSSTDVVKGKKDIEDKLKHSMHFTGFRIHPDNKQVVEVDLMAVAIMYRITLFQQGENGGQEQIECVASSTWRQTAGADWMLVSQLVAYAD